MTFADAFIKNIGDIIAASGKKRVWHALGNIIMIALAILCVFGIIKLAEDWPLGVIVGIILIIICVVGAFMFFVNGIIGQFVLLIVSAIGMKIPEERTANAVALTIAILSIIGMVIGLLFVIGVF